MPSIEWKHYLDDLYLARRHNPALVQDSKFSVLSELEMPISDSVAEAVDLMDGLTRNESPG